MLEFCPRSELRESAHLNGLSGNGLISHQGVESLVDSTEVDKVMTVQPRGDLVEHIIWNGVQLLGHVYHVHSRRKG